MKNSNLKTTLFVGIDVAKDLFDICVLEENGKVQSNFKISPTKAGFRKLITNLPPNNRTVIGMENTGPWTGNFFHLLKQLDVEIVIGHAKNVATLRTILSKSVKNDGIDAYVIAYALRMNILKDSRRDDRYIYLQDLLERYQDLKDRIDAIKNQLRASLVQTFLEFSNAFTNIACKASLGLLREIQTPEDFLDRSISEIKQIIKNAGGKMTKERVVKLQNAARNSIAWKKGEFNNRIIKSYTEELINLNIIRNYMEESIREMVNIEFKESVDLLRSVPGVGENIAWQFIAVVGDPSRFDPENDGNGAKRLSSYLGYGLKEYSSGGRVVRTGISKQGNSRMRGKLYMGAMVAIQHDEDLKAKFQLLKKKGNGKKALVATSHTLVRRMYGVLKNGKIYNPQIPLLNSHPPHGF